MSSVSVRPGKGGMIHVDFCWTLCYLLVIVVGVYGGLVLLITGCFAVPSITITILFYELENYRLLTSCASNMSGFCD